MSKRKRLAMAAVVFVVLAGAGVAFTHWWTAPTHAVGWRGYDRIEIGMTEQEVEAIVGRPPGWFEPLPEGAFQVYVHDASAEKGARDAVKGYSWVSTEGHLGVAFDAADRVVGVSFTPTRRGGLTWFDRLRRRLGV